MNQQDLTAPIDSVRISRREDFRRAYELYQDETIPQNLAGYVFSGILTGPGFYKLTLSESQGISRPNTHTVVVGLNLVQLGELAPGKYMLALFGDRATVREMFVQIELQVEP